LEVARHHADGEPLTRIEQCQRLTRRLLEDLREIVGAVRNKDSVDLPRILRPLMADIPRPHVHLALPENLKIHDPERAHTLVRCVQEIVTNAVKHARAENLWIEIVTRDGAVEVRARDDGRGAGQVQEGQGLTGMRERLQECGGRLEVHTEPRRGFHVAAIIPLPGARP